MHAAVTVVMFVVGFAAGGAAIWFVFRKLTEERLRDKDQTVAELRSNVAAKDAQLAQRDEEHLQLKQQQAVLQTTLKKEQEKIEEKVTLLAEAEKQFKDAFKALAADALKENNKEFDNLAKPVRATLNEINTRIAVVSESTTNLGAETSKLVKALQKPEVRGQWGEMHLRRVVELTGMADRCDFHEQQTIGDSECQQRPDLIIHLPGDKHLAVDAKAPIRAFLDAAEATDEQSRLECQKAFVSHVREHVKQLGSKAYHQNLDESPEFVVLYLPTEAVFSTVLTLDGELLEFATKYRVHLAGPTILITLLRAVAHGWKQESLAKHAKTICQLGEDLYKRLSVFGGHLAKIGTCLNRSVSAYNDAVGSLESRVLPQARKFEQLGAAPADAEINELAPIETTTRSLQAPEFALTANDDGEFAEEVLLGRPR